MANKAPLGPSVNGMPPEAPPGEFLPQNFVKNKNYEKFFHKLLKNFSRNFSQFVYRLVSLI